MEYLSEKGLKIWDRLTDAYTHIGLISSDPGSSNPETDYYFAMHQDADNILREKVEKIFGEVPRTEKTIYESQKLWDYLDEKDKREK